MRKLSRVCLVLGAAVAISTLAGAIPTLSAEERESALDVADYGFGTDVVDRELVGRAESFPEQGQVVFWTRVIGGRDGDRIYHVWSHEGKEVVTVGLSLGGSHWRTYSRKRMYPGSAGRWTAEVRDAGGNVLVSAGFTCESSGEDDESSER